MKANDQLNTTHTALVLQSYAASSTHHLRSLQYTHRFGLASCLVTPWALTLADPMCMDAPLGLPPVIDSGWPCDAVHHSRSRSYDHTAPAGVGASDARDGADVLSAAVRCEVVGWQRCRPCWRGLAIRGSALRA
jgi:hypothetical protein